MGAKSKDDRKTEASMGPKSKDDRKGRCQMESDELRREQRRQESAPSCMPRRFFIPPLSICTADIIYALMWLFRLRQTKETIRTLKGFLQNITFCYVKIKIFEMFVTIVSVMLFVEIFLSHFADFQKGWSRQQCLHSCCKIVTFQYVFIMQTNEIIFWTSKN